MKTESEIFAAACRVPSWENESKDSFALWRPTEIKDPPKDLLEFLWGSNGIEGRMAGPGQDIDPLGKDEDGLRAFFDLYSLYRDLRDLKKQAPELVKDEWLGWVAGNVPGILTCFAYSGCV